MKLHVFDLDDTLLCGDSEGAWINFLSTKGFFVNEDHASIMEQFEVNYRSGNFDPEKYCLYILQSCLLYTSPSPRDRQKSRMPSSA